MTSINLEKINEVNIQQILVRSKTTLLIIAAFLTGLLTAIKPIALFSIPAIVLIYGLYKAVVLYNQIKSIDLSIDAFNLPITDIVDDLESNNH